MSGSGACFFKFAWFSKTDVNNALDALLRPTLRRFILGYDKRIQQGRQI